MRSNDSIGRPPPRPPSPAGTFVELLLLATAAGSGAVWLFLHLIGKV